MGRQSVVSIFAQRYTYRLFPFHALDQLFVYEMGILAALLDQFGQLVLVPGSNECTFKMGNFHLQWRSLASEWIGAETEFFPRSPALARKFP